MMGTSEGSAEPYDDPRMNEACRLLKQSSWGEPYDEDVEAFSKDMRFDRGYVVHDHRLNPYWHPELWGCSSVCAPDFGGDWEFDIVSVIHGPDGFYIGTDDGCSCPDPFENYHSLSDYTGPMTMEGCVTEFSSLCRVRLSDRSYDGPLVDKDIRDGIRAIREAGGGVRTSLPSAYAEYEVVADHDLISICDLVTEVRSSHHQLDNYNAFRCSCGDLFATQGRLDLHISSKIVDAVFEPITREGYEWGVLDGSTGNGGDDDRHDEKRIRA